MEKYREFYIYNGDIENVKVNDAGLYEGPNVKKWILDRIKKRIKRLGLNIFIKSYQYEIIRIDLMELTNLTYHLIDNLCINNMTPKYIIMGYNQFRQISNVEFNDQLFNMYNDCTITYHKKHKRYLFNLPVLLIPNFDSIAVIPEESFNN